MKTVVWRQQNSDGTITAFYSDGSFAVVNAMTGQVVHQDDTPNPMRAAMFASGDSDAAIDSAQKDLSRENARRWDTTSGQKDRELDLRADDIANSYKVNMMNARTQQEQQRATAKYQQDQSQLARDRLAWDREYGQAGLGMDMVKTAASLRGPSDYFEASNLARGFSAMPGTSGFLGALQRNTQLPGFGAQGGAPQAETIGTLTQKLSGGGNQGAANNYLNQIHSIGAQGGGKVGAGVLEGLSPTESKLFIAGLGTADQQGNAYDPDTFLDQWRKSRIGQGIGATRAA